HLKLKHFSIRQFQPEYLDFRLYLANRKCLDSSADKLRNIEENSSIRRDLPNKDLQFRDCFLASFLAFPNKGFDSFLPFPHPKENVDSRQTTWERQAKAKAL